MSTVMLDESEQPIEVGDAADLIQNLRAEAVSTQIFFWYADGRDHIINRLISQGCYPHILGNPANHLTMLFSG